MNNRNQPNSSSLKYNEKEPIDFMDINTNQFYKPGAFKTSDVKFKFEHMQRKEEAVLREQPSLESLSSSVKSFSSDEQPSSSYWKVKDKEDFLTSLDVRDDRLCAIGSGSTTDNLFIYEAYTDEVIHHQTITLPEIVALKWAPLSSSLGQLGNVLLSGHRNGVVHMTFLPDSTARSGNAEILKRYNHMKHIPTDPTTRYSPRIRNMELTSANWSSCPAQSLFTLCADHIFLWEANRSDAPLIMQRTSNVNTLDLSADRDGVFAVGRKRGVCIRDIRTKDGVTTGLKPPVGNTHDVSLVKWNSYDSSNQFAAVHDRNVIKLWDIRTNQPLASFTGHVDNINSIEWSSRSEFITASADGTVRVWNTLSDGTPFHQEMHKQKNSPIEEESEWSDYQQRLRSGTELDAFGNDLLRDVPKINMSKSFTAMKLANMGPEVEAITIDTHGYLGIHELY